jgi:hypothetical protein
MGITYAGSEEMCYFFAHLYSGQFGNSQIPAQVFLVSRARTWPAGPANQVLPAFAVPQRQRHQKPRDDRSPGT